VKPIDTPRIDDLLERMTLAQKVGQMTQPERQFIGPDDVKSYHIGSVLSGGGSAPGDNRPADWVAMNDAYWAASTEADEHHLGIPLIYGVDAIHGNNNVRGATIFPHNIGLGAAHDPDLLRRIARVTAREILACGVEWTFAPTLAVARNPRWGRTYESYARDPRRVAECAAPFVEGLQSEGGAAGGVVACAKHWVGDGGTTDGIDQGETTLPEADLRSIHIAPYLPAIESGVLTVMASYNSWNGVRAHGNRRLLTEILKEELGFDGFVVSDWNGIDQLSADYTRAIEISVNAGVDMFMVPEEWRTFIARTIELVEAGRIPMARIDDAVRRILRVKEAYGLFDLPRPAERALSGSETFGSAEHREVAREAVRKSLVLLKNDDRALPLDAKARILVAGRAANSRGHLCGGFSVAWQGSRGNEVVEGGTSIWEAIEARGDGAVLSEDGSAEGDFDVAVVVVGENPYAEGFGDVRPYGRVELGSSLPNPGPQVSLTPYAPTLEHRVNHPEDLATIERIRARGIPVVTVFVSGRPLVTEAEISASSAFVAAWLPGSEGAGVTDVLFGDTNFRGALSFPWPAATDPDASPAFQPGDGLRY
jgi:beta-glucosidase